jgi:hypothetical protein
MAEKKLSLRAGREATKAWAELSAGERKESRRVHRFLEPDRMETPVPTVVLILDEDIPGNIVA